MTWLLVALVAGVWLAVALLAIALGMAAKRADEAAERAWAERDEMR